MLDPKVKLAWLEALRSGEYRQGHGTLAQKDAAGMSFCCLGVLTDLYIKAHPDEGTWESVAGKLRYDGREDLLPNSVKDWANPSGKWGALSQDTLAQLNDDTTDPMDFMAIADSIERRL